CLTKLARIVRLGLLDRAGHALAERCYVDLGERDWRPGLDPDLGRGARVERPAPAEADLLELPQPVRTEHPGLAVLKRRQLVDHLLANCVLHDPGEDGLAVLR